mmetsp:Transcript_46907/g.118954  ORF Transcript_46907/g.118954 Transcript_46907/m.118954 type:complete len:534 (+) Transcript_46907:75-1676(+)
MTASLALLHDDAEAARNFCSPGGSVVEGRVRSASVSSSGTQTTKAMSVATVSVEGHVLIPIPELEAEPRLSAGGLTANLTGAVLGTTVLGIAAQMKRGGWLLTPALLCIMGSVVAEMTRLVSMTISHLRETAAVEVLAYQDFAESSLGKWGRRWSMVTSTGDLIVYTFIALVLEAESFHVLFPIAWPWFGQDGCGMKWWSLFLSSSTVIYAFVDLAILAQFASRVGPLVCLSMVFLAWLGSFQELEQLSDFPESCRGSAETPFWTWWPTDVGSLASDVASIASYAMFCFAVVVTVPSVQSTMQEPKQLGSASTRAYLLSSIVFLSIMGLQYAGSGNLGPENIIEGMRSERPSGWWAMARPWETGTSTMVSKLFAIVVTSNLLLIDATYVPCAVIALETIAGEAVEQGGWPARVSIRLGLVVLRFAVATGVSSFIALSSFTSSLFCVSNNILIPILAFYATVGAQSISPARRVAHVAIFLFGCFIAVFGTINAVSALLDPIGSQAVASGLLPRPDASPECLALARDAGAEGLGL